jgi:RNA polymerase sigma-70 factor (ECF subfamily)
MTAGGGAAITSVVPAESSADALFEAMLAERYLELLRLAVLLAGNQPDGEDAVQLAIERAWRSRAQLRDVGALTSWLRRIVVREVVRRQTSPWARLTRNASPIDLTAIPATTVDRDVHLALLRALAHLPAAQRAVVVLHHHTGYRVDEVAEIVGAPVETVRSRLRLAMNRLRLELEA